MNAGTWAILGGAGLLALAAVLLFVRNDGEAERPITRLSRALAALWERRPGLPAGNAEERELDAMAQAGLLDINTYMFRQQSARRHKQIMAALLLLVALAATAAGLLAYRLATRPKPPTCRYTEEIMPSGATFVTDTVSGRVWRRRANGALAPIRLPSY